MKVKYTGNYRKEASLCFRGVSFAKGKSTEVTEEWLKTHDCSKLEVEAKPKAKPKAKDK